MDHVTGQGLLIAVTRELATFLDHQTRRTVEVGPWANSSMQTEHRALYVRDNVKIYRPGWIS
jgi:hypothetical protein